MDRGLKAWLRIARGRSTHASPQLTSLPNPKFREWDDEAKNYKRRLAENKVYDWTHMGSYDLTTNPEEFDRWLAMRQGWVQNSEAKANLHGLEF